MSIVVTGATGHLGRLTVESLVNKGVDPQSITATGRQVEKLNDLAAKGVRVVRADFSDSGSLDDAFDGAEKVLLVSGLDADRVKQHQNVIDAAVRADVAHFVYTSAPFASSTSMKLAEQHAETETLIKESGLTSTILRNNWYIENYTGQLETYLQHGMTGAAGKGLVSVALRAEYAEANAEVLTGKGHDGKVYELGGDPVTLADIAEAITNVVGQHIRYNNVPVDRFRSILEGAGLPEAAAEIFSDVDRAIADGEMNTPPADLTKLLGRKPTPLAEQVKISLKR